MGKIGIFTQKLEFLRPDAVFEAQIAVARRVDFGSAFPEGSGEQNQRRRGTVAGGRLVAAYAVSELVRRKPEEIRILKGVFEQPLVVTGDRDPPDVSITHLGGGDAELFAAIAFPRAYPLGIDLELSQRVLAPEILATFSPRERGFLVEANGTPSASLAGAIWTCRESLAKAIRTGLMISLDLLEVSELKILGKGFSASFSHFPQYGAWGWIIGDTVLALVGPRSSTLSEFDRIGELLRQKLREPN